MTMGELETQAAGVLAATADGYRFKNTENADKKLVELAAQRASAKHYHWVWGATENYRPTDRATCIICIPGALAEFAQNVAAAYHEEANYATFLAGV